MNAWMDLPRNRTLMQVKTIKSAYVIKTNLTSYITVEYFRLKYNQ